MARTCRECGTETQEVFDIPWLAKFYRCEQGHCEARDQEGGRFPFLHNEYLRQMNTAREFVGGRRKGRRRSCISAALRPRNASGLQRHD
jgi:hypothetical protein